MAKWNTWAIDFQLISQRIPRFVSRRRPAYERPQSQHLRSAPSVTRFCGMGGLLSAEGRSAALKGATTESPSSAPPHHPRQPKP